LPRFCEYFIKAATDCPQTWSGSRLLIEGFGPVVWLAPEQVDDTYFSLLPAKATEITIEEIAELSAVFGQGGELQAERLS
jgi:hypothetical protein